MLPERGYVRARQLLKDRFGDEFVIAELWGQRLLSTSNRMSLREFADELRAGYESLSALDALDELQTQNKLSKIVKKLPEYLQNRWRDVVRRLKVHEHRRPDMRDVVEYVEVWFVLFNDTWSQKGHSVSCVTILFTSKCKSADRTSGRT